ncbi:MAG: hypothetical protein MUF23_17215 [Pirellula sp.]|nr:hypothetical protein [Pirellula sp.]
MEELIGLAESGVDGVALVRDIYSTAMEKIDELTAPYASVIDIDRDQLPSVQEVGPWKSSDWVGALRHDPSHAAFNPSLRQLLHVSFKLAAKQGTRYTDLLDANADVVGRNVFENIYIRHMKPLFIGDEAPTCSS